MQPISRYFCLFLTTELLFRVKASANFYRTHETFNGSDLPCNSVQSYNESLLNMTTGPTDPNNLVWIAAYLSYTKWFDYKGCYKLFNRKNVYSEVFLRTPSLYDCYNTCTNVVFYPFIGIQHNMCYCLKDGEYGSWNQCNASICSDNPLLLCGDGDINVAVYSILNLTLNEIDSQLHGHCGTLYKGGGGARLKVLKCNEKAYPVCFDEGNCDRSSNVIYDQTETWVDSMKKCENMQLTPSSSFQIRSNIALSNDGYYWTSTIRGSKVLSLKAGLIGGLTSVILMLICIIVVLLWKIKRYRQDKDKNTTSSSMSDREYEGLESREEQRFYDGVDNCNL